MSQTIPNKKYEGEGCGERVVNATRFWTLLANIEYGLEIRFHLHDLLNKWGM
jgi:hypothetical protein